MDFGGREPEGTAMFLWLRKAAKPAQAQNAGAPADCAGDEFTSRCRELGVEAALSEIAGISPPMLVALGENGIKTVEDLAGCPPMICMAGSSRQAARPRATWARSTASGSRATSAGP